MKTGNCPPRFTRRALNHPFLAANRKAGIREYLKTALAAFTDLNYRI
jgi:hypothetical protein